MRKITEIREFNVYKFDELSQAAKEKVVTGIWKGNLI